MNGTYNLSSSVIFVLFMLLAAVATMAAARPDIGISSNYLPASGGGGYTGGTGYTGGSSSFQKTSFTSGSTGGGFGTGGGGGGGGTFQSFGGGGGGYQGGRGSISVSGGGGDFGGSQQQAVTNAVYFYDAPEDEIVQAASIRVNGGGGAQHNRVVFIKAPGYQQQQITNIGGNVGGSGEKTRIYVLAKRPQGQQDVIINTASGSSVAKPEVYYIKYNTQQDAEEQILASVNGQSSGNQAQSVGSDHAFVQTIRDTVDVRSAGPIVHNIGGAGSHTAEPGAQILGLAGAKFTNGEITAQSGIVTSSGSSSHFQSGGGHGGSIGGGIGGGVGGVSTSYGTPSVGIVTGEPYQYNRPN